MARAFLFVLDSFGVGGADDAARFGDAGSNTFGHIAEACAAGEADREGLRQGPLDLPNMISLGLGHARRRRRQAYPFDRGQAPRRPPSTAPRRKSHRARTRRPAIGRSPACRCRFDWGYFPQHGPDLPGRTDRGDHPRRQAARHTRRLPCVRHRDHRAVRRGAHPHRQADLLHLGRLRHPDRRA